MKLKKFVVGVIVVSFSTVIYAQKINLSIWTGYATVDMKDVNGQLELLKRHLDSMVEDFKKIGGSGKTSLTKLGNGIICGADLGYELFPGLSLGSRISYLHLFKGEVFGEGSATVMGTTARFKVNATYDLSLIPIMVGGTYSKDLTEQISLSGGLYLGLGLANAAFNVSQEATNIPNMPSLKFKVPAQGSGFVADISARAGYEIVENISIALNLGYRFATIPEMKATKDVPEAKVKKGDVAKTADDKTLKFDYSGLTAGLGVNFKF